MAKQESASFTEVTISLPTSYPALRVYFRHVLVRNRWASQNEARDIYAEVFARIRMKLLKGLLVSLRSTSPAIAAFRRIAISLELSSFYGPSS
jgi:hypothetical protein